MPCQLCRPRTGARYQILESPISLTGCANRKSVYLVVPVTAARLANRRRALVSSGNWPLYEECWKVIKHILATTGNQSEVAVVEVTNIHAVPRESSAVPSGGNNGQQLPLG